MGEGSRHALHAFAGDVQLLLKLAAGTAEQCFWDVSGASLTRGNVVNGESGV